MDLTLDAQAKSKANPGDHPLHGGGGLSASGGNRFKRMSLFVPQAEEGRIFGRELIPATA
jgi:hypothetical protein